MIGNIISLRLMNKLLLSILTTLILELIKGTKNILVALLNIKSQSFKKKNNSLTHKIDPISFSRRRRKSHNTLLGQKSLMILECISSQAARKNSFTLKPREDKNVEIKLKVYIMILDNTQEIRMRNI